MIAVDYTRVTSPDPHVERGRRLVAAHPERRRLAGPMPVSAAWLAGLVAAQLAIALAVAHQPWYVWLAAVYVAGATIDHALWVMVHECAHNLVLSSRVGNRIVAMVANLPMVIPSPISFCKYHLLHDLRLGELEYDADLPGPLESRIGGDTSWMKAAWLAAFAAVHGFVRWIQEHYVFEPGQETYSYYGPLNRVCFNVGHHNEHHDLVSVPWARLPQIRAVAPEFYEPLRQDHSWTRPLLDFLRDRRVTLYSRMVR